MAKQREGLQLEGTIGDITFYCLNGKYYARRKSSLKRKTVKYHPHFALTRLYASCLGKASSITSAVYKSLPKERQVYALYCELRSCAYEWIKEGLKAEEVRERLEEKVKPRESVLVVERKKLGKVAAGVNKKAPEIEENRARLVIRKDRLFVSMPFLQDDCRMIKQSEFGILKEQVLEDSS